LIQFFSLIAHTKVAKVVLSGEPDNFKPFGNFAEGLLFFNKLFSRKKKDFESKESNIKMVLIVEISLDFFSFL